MTEAAGQAAPARPDGGRGGPAAVATAAAGAADGAPGGAAAARRTLPGIAATATALTTVAAVWRGSAEPFAAPKLAVLLPGAAATLVLLGAARRLRVPRPVWVACAVGAVAWVLAATAAPVWERELLGVPGRGTGTLPALAGLVLVAALAAGTRRDADTWWAALVGVGAVQGVVVLAQAAGLDPFDWGPDAVVGTQGNRDFAAATCAIGLAPAVVALRCWPRPWSLVAGAAAAAAAGGVVAAGAGQGWAAAVAGLAAVATAAVWARLGRRVRRAVAAGWLVAAVAAGAFLAVADGDDVADRRASWRIAASLAADEPLTGVGPTGFSRRYTAERSPEAAAASPLLVFDDPHSVPLHVAAATGVAGLAALAALHVATGRRLLGSVRVAASPAVLAVLGAWVAWWVQATVSIDQPGLAVLGAATTGAAWSATTAEQRRRGWHRPVLAAAAACALVLAADVGVANLVASHHLREAERARDRRDVAGALAHLDVAASWWPFDHRVPTLQAIVLLRRGDATQAAAYAVEAARLGPGLAEPAGIAAMAFEDAGDVEAAASWRREWLRADPHNPLALALAAGAPSVPEVEARVLLADAADPEPRTREAWLAIGDAYTGIGDVHAALDAYRRALAATEGTAASARRVEAAPTAEALFAEELGRRLAVSQEGG